MRGGSVCKRVGGKALLDLWWGLGAGVYGVEGLRVGRLIAVEGGGTL